MKKNIPTIILTGGGSGGHITPLLPLARVLKEKSPACKIIYIGLKGEKLEGLQERYTVFDQVSFVTSGKFRRYHGQSALAHLVDFKTLLLNGRDIFKILIGVVSARKLLKKFAPDVVFSKGGYVVVPVGIAAHRLGIPIITHDSDAVPGLANRIIGRWAAIHAVGQPIDHYAYPKGSLRYTGIPIDERIKKVTSAEQADFKNDIGLTKDSLVLLVSGGGLGAQRLNELTLAVAPELLSKLPDLRIINIAGGTHQATTQAEYEKIPQAEGRVQVIGFTPEFYKYSGAADLIITRAGATSVAEFALQHKACVVIPAAQLSAGHQLKNAKELADVGAAKVLDSDIEPTKLLKVLLELLQNKQGRAEIGAKLGRLARPQAAAELADLILQMAGNQ